MSLLRPARIAALLLCVAGVCSAGRSHAQSSPTGAPTAPPTGGGPAAAPSTGSKGSSKDAPAGLGGDGLGIAYAVQSKFQQLAEQNADSVVTVTAFVKQDSRAPDSSDKGAGHWVQEGSSHELPGHVALRSCSGFVMSLAGDVLTCRSMLLRDDGSLPDIITVETKDGSTTICSLIATEPTLDLALLRFEVFVDGFAPRFTVGRFGDSSIVYPGTMTVALGDPSGPGVFLTSALISSLPTRECYQEQKSATYLQATMIAHPEAYGGPLVNLDGEIIGMLQPRLTHSDALAPFRTSGIEYALPSNIINTIYQALLQKKSLTSPWIGIAIMSRAELRRERGPDAFDQMSKPGWGVFIENTFDPSPASAAGILPGDFLVKLDGNPVVDPGTFQRLMYLAGIDADVKLEMFRAGNYYDVTVKIVQRPPEAITR